MNKDKSSALVVLSGGQDSVTCLGLALAKHEHVEAISFYYSQRHAVELETAANLCKKYGVDHKVVDLSFLAGLVTSALTGEGSVAESHPHLSDLPASFVPCRNALFLTVAHAHAQETGCVYIYTGVCQTDYSGYPDCRDVFVKQLNLALNTGYEASIQIVTPLMFLTKAETFALADRIGFLPEVVDQSHTCYEGDHTTRNDWGYGCGECPACRLRAKGWTEYTLGNWRFDEVEQVRDGALL